MTARVFRCTRCGTTSTVYIGTRPDPRGPGCDRDPLRRHAWRLAF